MIKFRVSTCYFKPSGPSECQEHKVKCPSITNFTEKETFFVDFNHLYTLKNSWRYFAQVCFLNFQDTLRTNFWQQWGFETGNNCLFLSALSQASASIIHWSTLYELEPISWSIIAVNHWWPYALLLRLSKSPTILINRQAIYRMKTAQIWSIGGEMSVVFFFSAMTT